MKTRILCVSVLVLICCTRRSLAQQYFRLLENSTKPYEQKIARFANGDILLSGSPISGELSDQSGGLNFTRLDKCGNVSWATNYQWEQKYMSLKDVVVSDIGDIYAYGSAYEGLTEYIFLLKLSGKGVVLGFRVFHPGTVDHFTYNIEIKNNRILAYGLLLHYNTVKRGFVAVFNDQLHFLWSKVFEPFESSGKAIITDDNGFLCHSGPFLTKLNAQGELLWATKLQEEDNSNWQTVAGPLLVQDGYIFESSDGVNAFFYKLNKNGALIWKSPQFLTTNTAANFIALPNGNILAMYAMPNGTEQENEPCQLVLSSNGNIIHQRKLVIDNSLQTASIHISLGKNNTVTAIGNTDIRAAYLNGPAGFILQFSIDSLRGNCFRWETFKSLSENNVKLEFTPLEISFFESTMNSVEATLNKPSIRTFNLQESCNFLSEDLTHFDTLLLCGQTWQVSLPNTDFVWEDEVIANPRILDHPGIYRASNKDCISPITYEFNLTREPCLCNVFLPTAFSPNHDGQNDKLELFSNCTLEGVQLSIYNRWGNKVFFSNTADTQWDGTVKQKPADAGIYIAVVRYQLLNESNEIQEGSLVQNITLIR